MNEIGATLSATSTKLNKSGKLEPSASAVHSTWTYTDKPVAVCHTTQTCDLWWHRNRHSASGGWQPLGTRATSASPCKWEPGPSYTASFVLQRFPLWASHQGEQRVQELRSTNHTSYLLWSLLGEREMMRTNARLDCEAEGSSQETQPVNTKPEHPGWWFLSFQSDANQVTYYCREEGKES